MQQYLNQLYVFIHFIYYIHENRIVEQYLKISLFVVVLIAESRVLPGHALAGFLCFICKPNGFLYIDKTAL